jgi:type II secretory pathway pseudopilin PulG
MKKTIYSRGSAGFTLVELMLVLGLLVLVSGALLFGYSAYRDGANKSLCLVNQQSVQDKMRSYAALNGLNVGDSLASTAIIGSGLFIEVAPTCKGGGTYTYGTTVPATGTAYCTCSKHTPASTSGW